MARKRFGSSETNAKISSSYKYILHLIKSSTENQVKLFSGNQIKKIN